MSKNVNAQFSFNSVTITGKLLDMTVVEGETKGDKKPYIRASGTIRVNDSFSGEPEVSEIPVSFFANKYTNKNVLNPIYESVDNLRHLKTAQQYGIDEADVLSVRKGQLQENNFIARSGSLINGWQIRSSFYNIGGKKDAAYFDVDIFILDMQDEHDRDGDPTGRLMIKGGIVQYGGRLDVLEFVVEAPDKVDYLSRNWNIHDTVRAQGHIRVTSKEVTQAVGTWGETIPTSDTRAVRELVITGGSDNGYEEDLAYDEVDIRKLFQIRKANIEQMVQAAKKPAAPENSGSSDYDWK